MVPNTFAPLRIFVFSLDKQAIVQIVREFQLVSKHMVQELSHSEVSIETERHFEKLFQVPLHQVEP